MTIRAARLYGVGDIRIVDEPAPVPGPGEELVRVDAVGLCGSDIHWFTEGSIGDAGISQPLVLGHEMGGTVLAGPRAGQRVAIDPSIPCLICPPCRRGNPNLCINVRFAGHGGTDGGLREQLAWPADRLHAVPDSIDAAGVAVLEPLGVALHAIDLGHVRVGDAVGIVGCGPIGLLAVQLAYRAGAATVFAVEPLTHRRELAVRFGAVVDEAAVDLDVVIEVAGTDAAVETAIELCRPGARLVLAGIPEGDRTSFIASGARRKGLTIAMSRRMAEVYPRTIALVGRGRIDVDAVVSHTFGLDDTSEALRTAVARTGCKVIVKPGAAR